MSSICWTGYDTKSSISTDLRRRAYLVVFFVLLWTVNLSIVLLGLPFILASKLSPRKLRPGREPAAPGKLPLDAGARGHAK